MLCDQQNYVLKQHAEKNIKGVLLCFNQCVVYMFWAIQISTKLHISNCTTKGDIIFPRTTTNGVVWNYSLIPVFVISQSGPLEYHSK